jgi:hypothetical protein
MTVNVSDEVERTQLKTTLLDKLGDGNLSRQYRDALKAEYLERISAYQAYRLAVNSDEPIRHAQSAEQAMFLAKEQRERHDELRRTAAANTERLSTREWQAEMRKAAKGPTEEPPVNPRELFSSAADDGSILRVMTALSPIRKLPAVTLSKLKKLHQVRPNICFRKS